VQHDLVQRDEGNGEPVHVPIARLISLALLAAALVMNGGCGLFTTAPVIAMVSGRDDHGLIERPAIGLRRTPTDVTIVATAHDGEFAYVLRRDGLYAYVRLVGSGDEGWIADHDLRGEAVRIDPPPPRRVLFTAAEKRDGAAWVRVRYTVDGGEEWVPAVSLREVGAR